MSDSNPENMSRAELLASLQAAEMQRDAVDDLIRKQQDLIRLMEQKMVKLNEMTPETEQPEGDAASDASNPTEEKSDT